MAEERVERRLAAILCADVAGYSRLMGADEEGTLALLKRDRRELIDPLIAFENGEGAFLVRAHQPRISGNVGAKNRRQPPFNALFRHERPPSSQAVYHSPSRSSYRSGVMTY